MKDLPLKLVEMEGEFAAWHACLEAIVIRLFINHVILILIDIKSNSSNNTFYNIN